MRRTAFLLLVLGFLCWLPAATDPIGMAMTSGSFQVDHSRVSGNSTLFDGSIIETQSALAELQLTGGVQMRLASDSRATVYQRKLVLDYGQAESAPNYEVQANTLHIVATGPDGLARVQVRSQRYVLVAAVRGAVRVTNAGGVLVANVEAGKTLNLEPQDAGAGAPTRVTGCLLAKGGKMIIVEQTANVILEMHGPGLDKELGNRVEINGVSETAPSTVAGASQVVRVVGLKRVAPGGCAAVAKKVGAAVAAAGSVAAAGTAAGAAAGAAGVAVPAAAGAAAGIGMGTVAIIGGVAAAASVGALGIAGALPGQGNSPSVSR